MSEGKVHEQSQDYKWTNRKQFEDSKIQELGDKLQHKESEQTQQQNIGNLFQKLMRSSNASLLYMNHQTKQMTLYSKPQHSLGFQLNRDKLNFFGYYRDIKNRFNYLGTVNYKYGQRGTTFYLGAINSHRKPQYVFSYTKTLWERLDNYYTSNVDNFAFHLMDTGTKYADFYQLTLSKESRQNQINFLNKSQQTTLPCGLNQPQAQLPKHSNLMALQYVYKYPPFAILGKFGVDFGNNSFFKSLGLRIKKDFNIGDFLKVYWSLEVENIWGKNILKNDLLFRNNKSWPGSRTKNYIQNRIQVMFLKYPYFSLLNICPYLYTSLWAIFNHNEREQQYDIRLEAQYGIGIQSESALRKLDIALFRCSVERKAEVFGSIKFSF